MNIIRNRFTGEVIFKDEAPSLKALVERAAELGIDLSMANLCQADLRAAELGNVMLSGAKLTKADLTEARLLLANLEGSNLTGAVPQKQGWWEHS